RLDWACPVETADSPTASAIARIRHLLTMGLLSNSAAKTSSVQRLISRIARPRQSEICSRYVAEASRLRTRAGAAMTKIIVITGATRGLGRALLDHFIPSGHRVFGCGRSEADIEKLRRGFAGKGDFTVLNVSDAAGVERWAKHVLATTGPPDLLINN